MKWIVLGALLAVVATPTFARIATPVVASPAPEKMAIARRIADKMRYAERTMFAITKFAPVFAQQVIAKVRESSSSPFAADLATPEGTAKASTALAEEYTKAFRARAGELTDAVALQFASKMSIAELAQIERFIDTPAGHAWVETLGSAQNESSAVGQQIGAKAGAEAVAAAFGRLHAPSESDRHGFPDRPARPPRP